MTCEQDAVLVSCARNIADELKAIRVLMERSKEVVDASKTPNQIATEWTKHNGKCFFCSNPLHFIGTEPQTCGYCRGVFYMEQP